MIEKIRLTARQLFCLAHIVKAEYIDYFYVSAVGNELDKFDVYKSEIINELMSKGYISEDFGGNIEIEPEVLELLKPVFFSNREATLDITELGENENVTVYKFHISDEIVQATIVDDELEISKIEVSDISSLVNSLIPSDYECENVTHINSFNDINVTQIVSVKNIILGEESVVKTYIKSETDYYQESNGDVISSVSRDDLIDGILSILTEVM